MAAETAPLSIEQLRKRTVQLRSFVDQGDFNPSDDEPLLGQVFTEEELDAIEEHHSVLYVALTRLEEDYATLCESSSRVEASQDAIAAHVVVIELESGDDGDDDGGDDDDGDDGDDRYTPNEPDADLD